MGAWPLWSMRPEGRWRARLHLAGHRRWLAPPRSGERAARVARAAHAALHFALARPAAAVASRLQPCGVAGLSPALSRAVARDGGCSETGSQAVHRFRAQKLRCVHQRACYPRGRPSACSRRRALLPATEYSPPLHRCPRLSSLLRDLTAVAHAESSPTLRTLRPLHRCSSRSEPDGTTVTTVTAVTQVFQQIEPEAIELMRALLEPDPERRMTMGAALEHEWIESALQVGM